MDLQAVYCAFDAREVVGNEIDSATDWCAEDHSYWPLAFVSMVPVAADEAAIFHVPQLVGRSVALQPAVRGALALPLVVADKLDVVLPAEIAVVDKRVAAVLVVVVAEAVVAEAVVVAAAGMRSHCIARADTQMLVRVAGSLESSPR